MKKVTEVIHRIKSYYVGNDCVQIRIPYQNPTTILNQDGILFHSKQGSDFYINKYLEDERRKQFPYSNIPISYSKVDKKKVAYTNQLLEFEKPYIQIENNAIYERFVIKDNNQALLVKSIRESSKPIEKHLTYDQLLKFISKSDSPKKQTYYTFLDGNILSDYPTEEEIYKAIKRKLEKDVRYLRKCQQTHSDIVSQYLSENSWFLDYIEQSINNINLSLIDFNFNIGINDESTILIIKIKKGDIKIQGVNVMFIRENDFKVNIFDIPVSKYTLEQLKYAPNIKFLKDPKLSLRLNPSVTKQDIQEAKQMIKTLRNNK